MQFRQDTLVQLRRKIGFLMHRDNFIFGTVLASPAPTSTTFALETTKKYPSNHFDGEIVYSVSGTGLGQSAFVDASAVGTGVITVTPALGVVFGTSTVVEIWPDSLKPDAVNNAINLALDDLGDVINVYAETISPTLNSDRDEITIPATLVKMVDIRYQDAGGRWVVYRHAHTPEYYGQEQGRDFTVEARVAYLSEPIPSDALIYKISGYRLPAQLALDADLAEGPPAFLVFKAASLLEQSLAGNADLDPEGHSGRSTAWAGLAMLQKPAGNFTNFVPNTFVLES